MTNKIQNFRHFDLCEYTARLVVAECCSIPNRKGVWPFHRYLSGLTTVEFRHTLDFGERDKVTIFKSVACLV